MTPAQYKGIVLLGHILIHALIHGCRHLFGHKEEIRHSIKEKTRPMVSRTLEEIEVRAHAARRHFDSTEPRDSKRH
jgi:hypothetical protein